MALAFVPLGVGDAFSAIRYSSCVAIEADGRWLLVDCPHPIRKILREGSIRSGAFLDVDSFEAIAITHVHADHASGLEGLGFFSHFVLKKRPRVLAHPRVAEGLWDGRLSAGMRSVADATTWANRARTFSDYFDLDLLDDARPVRVGPFEVECRRTRHVVPTTALRIRGGGRCLAISSDTAFDAELVDWLAEADLFLHETGPSIHTPYDRLAELPAPIRSKARLIHYPDAFDVAASVIEPLVEGRKYEVK